MTPLTFLIGIEWDDSLKAFRITGRVKDLFKTEKGKYVAPVPIESKLAENDFMEQICVMGSGLAQPVAVAVLSENAEGKPESEILDDKKLRET